MEMENMMNTAKKLDTMFRVLQWLMLIFLAVAVLSVSVLTIVALRNPDALVEGAVYSLSLGPVTLELASGYTAESQAILTCIWVILIMGSTSVLAGYFCFKYLRNILAPMQQGNPFHEDASRNLKKLAWVVLVLGIIRNLTNLTGGIAVMKLVDFAAFEAFNAATVHMDLELGFLLVFFGLLLLSYIFHYGAVLQKLSDETL